MKATDVKEDGYYWLSDRYNNPPVVVRFDSHDGRFTFLGSNHRHRADGMPGNFDGPIGHPNREVAPVKECKWSFTHAQREVAIADFQQAHANLVAAETAAVQADEALHAAWHHADKMRAAMERARKTLHDAIVLSTN